MLLVVNHILVSQFFFFKKSDQLVRIFYTKEINARYHP